MASHFHEFLNRLYQQSDFDSGRVFSEIEIFTGPSELDREDVHHFLQVYGDYILGLVKNSFPSWPYHLIASVQISPIDALYQERYWLSFTTTLPISDEMYEVVLEKREFIDGKLAKNKTDFNRKTSQLVMTLVNRLNNLGSDDDRKIGIALPIY